MSHVFLSYANEDKGRVALFVRELESRGIKIWWDRQIVPGRKFDFVIEEALNASAVIIVIWSIHSINSDWVKAEAAHGSKRGILIPILLDNCRPPIEFSRLHTVSMENWDGRNNTDQFERIFTEITALSSTSTDSLSARGPIGSSPETSNAQANITSNPRNILNISPSKGSHSSNQILIHPAAVPFFIVSTQLELYEIAKIQDVLLFTQSHDEGSRYALTLFRTKILQKLIEPIKKAGLAVAWCNIQWFPRKNELTSHLARYGMKFRGVFIIRSSCIVEFERVSFFETEQSVYDAAARLLDRKLLL